MPDRCLVVLMAPSRNLGSFIYGSRAPPKNSKQLNSCVVESTACIRREREVLRHRRPGKDESDRGLVFELMVVKKLKMLFTVLEGSSFF